VFSKPQNGKRTFNVFLAKGAESRSVEAVGKKIVADAEVSFGPKPNSVKAGDYTFFAGSRSDAGEVAQIGRMQCGQPQCCGCWRGGSPPVIVPDRMRRGSHSL
jgi:hypothetical protein